VSERINIRQVKPYHARLPAAEGGVEWRLARRSRVQYLPRLIESCARSRGFWVLRKIV
jgi:hypothetical protein